MQHATRHQQQSQSQPKSFNCNWISVNVPACLSICLALPPSPLLHCLSLSLCASFAICLYIYFTLSLSSPASLHNNNATTATTTGTSLRLVIAATVLPCCSWSHHQRKSKPVLTCSWSWSRSCRCRHFLCSSIFQSWSSGQSAPPPPPFSLSFPVSRFRLLMVNKFSTQGAFPNISNRCCLLRTQLSIDVGDDYVNYAQSEVAFLNRIFISLLHHSVPRTAPRAMWVKSKLEPAMCNLFYIFVACPLRNGTTSHTTKNHLRIA